MHDNDDKWDDFSPAGRDAYRGLLTRMLADVDALEEQGWGRGDDVTAAALRDRLGVALELDDLGEWKRDLNNIASPFQYMRDAFALMPRDSAEDGERLRARIASMGTALEGARLSLAEGLATGTVPARRQVCLVAQQIRDFIAPGGYLDELTIPAAGGTEEQWQAAASAAREGLSAFARWLTETLAPAATDTDGVGKERYEVLSREFVGAKIDLDDAYEWGLARLGEVVTRQREIARELYGPGVDVPEALERLNADPSRQLHGTDALREWMQGWADRALNEVGSELVDIDPRVATIECHIDPSGTGGIYYMAPSEDFARPGRMCWAVPPGEDTFHTWQELTTVFHEGVPGHHLQLGAAMCAGLNKWRAVDCWLSGHGEGWALYAESLMTELGYESEPGELMGYLDSQRLRLARVALDIGVHLGKPVPKEGPWAEGLRTEGTWDGDYAWDFLKANVAMAEGFLRFECDRYLGWPGQAPSYALGQRFWRQLREDYVAAAGFDEGLPLRGADGRIAPIYREFHTRALQLGSLPLDVLRAALLS